MGNKGVSVTLGRKRSTRARIAVFESLRRVASIRMWVALKAGDKCQYVRSGIARALALSTGSWEREGDDE